MIIESTKARMCALITILFLLFVVETDNWQLNAMTQRVCVCV